MARTHPKLLHKKVDKRDRLEYLRYNLTCGRRGLGGNLQFRRQRWENFKIVYLKPARNFDCYLCAGQSDDWHHIVPVDRGGEDSVFNLVPLCSGCHKKVHRHDRVRGNRASLSKIKFVSPLVNPEVFVVFVPKTI